ncbi:MAG: hypothetical protein KGJ68_06265, partial [Gammaproteobacteria bacterium]|nr:hypothetical protein [Gammaproteobacteria bacterium]
VEVQRQLNQTLSSITRETLAQEQAIRRSDADTEIAIARMNIEAKKQALDEEVEAGRVSASQKLETLRQLTDAEFQLNLQALNAELAALKQSPAEYERVYNQIRQLKAKEVLDLAELDRQSSMDAARQAKAQATAWKGAVAEIESAEGTMVSDLIGKRRSLAQSLEQIGLQLATKEIQNDLKAMTTRLLLAKNEETQKNALEQGGYLYHLLFSNQTTTATVASQAAQTSATITGLTTRQSAEAAAAAESKTARALIGGQTVLADAAKAFSGTYASVSSIPVVGWVLAPFAASAAYAAVAAYEGLASLDTGTMNVPSDMTARIHKGEAVLPVPFAQGLRQSLAGGSAGGAAGSPAPVNITLPGRTSGNMFTANIDDLKDALNLLVRKQGGTPVFR